MPVAFTEKSVRRISSRPSRGRAARPCARSPRRRRIAGRRGSRSLSVTDVDLMVRHSPGLATPGHDGSRSSMHPPRRTGVACRCRCRGPGRSRTEGADRLGADQSGRPGYDTDAMSVNLRPGNRSSSRMDRDLLHGQLPIPATGPSGQRGMESGSAYGPESGRVHSHPRPASRPATGSFRARLAPPG